MIDIWTEKYRPKNLSEIVGQEENVRKLKSFVERRELPHLIFAGPSGIGKTTAALAIAMELFGQDWKQNILELNASNERGIDVIRENVKDFARIMASNDLGFKIIFLDEADQLTPEAQAALRRTMEVYSSTTRFIFSCNYSSQIIPPIQSRTVVMRFKPVKPEDMVKRLRFISDQEKLTIDNESLLSIAEASEGDMRRALNVLQSVKASGNSGAMNIFEIQGMANKESFRKLAGVSLAGLFNDAREMLDRMLIEEGLSGIDIIRGMHSAIRKENMPAKQKIQVIMALGDAEFRLVEGSNDNIQLDAMIARICNIGQEIN
ncbi:MAG: Replication factor C small subunit [Thermoplasmatales archaeon B_DKE]|nr:MAG: Replication factor C small subunit [Thermoplasmatales archaeon B_DKE]